jgi:hypothetical protein
VTDVVTFDDVVGFSAFGAEFFGLGSTSFFFQKKKKEEEEGEQRATANRRSLSPPPQTPKNVPLFGSPLRPLHSISAFFRPYNARTLQLESPGVVAGGILRR